MKAENRAYATRNCLGVDSLKCFINYLLPNNILILMVHTKLMRIHWQIEPSFVEEKILGSELQKPSPKSSSLKIFEIISPTKLVIAQVMLFNPNSSQLWIILELALRKLPPNLKRFDIQDQSQRALFVKRLNKSRQVSVVIELLEKCICLKLIVLQQKMTFFITGLIIFQTHI
ncbi:hypothetical protein BpHYR1_001672 [Brachionus plicatilis]|uniref:Uncharacterized protein n=1 Tax=Brachionus plicatilis TaxID=10195 RepID=A0A3M7P9X4_BRAPC|nr:hypothetical protein BpHYR1_001672 [Brachionus plicatilis]